MNCLKSNNNIMFCYHITSPKGNCLSVMFRSIGIKKRTSLSVLSRVKLWSLKRQINFCIKLMRSKTFFEKVL